MMPAIEPGKFGQIPEDQHEGMQYRGRAALQRRVKIHNPRGLQPRVFECVGRKLPSVAFDFDVVLDSDSDFDFDREGHGLSRAAKPKE